MRDDQHPDTCYKQKLEYYDMSEIRKWVGETTGCRFIHFAVERYFLSRHRFKYSDYKIISLLWSKLQETTCWQMGTDGVSLEEEGWPD